VPHVLFLNEFYWPDVCASSAVLSDHLPKLAALRPGWRITVLAGDRAWDRPEVTWPPRERRNGIEIVRVPRGPVRRTLAGRGLGFARFHRAAMKAGRRVERPDVVIASTAPPLGGRIGAAVARLHAARLIYRVLDLYPDCAAALGVIRAGGPVERIWRRADARIMRQADAVVAISRRIAERIGRTRQIDAARLSFIHDGFDARRVPPAEPNRFRDECGLTGRFVVQYAGNMGLSHPFETILAAARLLAGDSSIAFQFIGAGPERTRVETQLADPSLRGVDLRGYQPAERLAEVLDTADVALITQEPAMFDLALPYKIYALLAAGRPCVFLGDRRSEIAEWLREDDCGVQIEQGDAEGLAAAIRALRDDRERRTEMGRRARALFEQRFRSETAVGRWAELIERVLGGTH